MGLTNMKGDVAELAVATRYLELGYWVSKPFGDDAPYDLIVDFNGELKRIQVKHVKPKNECLNIKLNSSTGKKYKETVDLIAAWDCVNKNVYEINPNNFKAEKILALRLKQTKNNQSSGVIYAEKYIL